MRNTIENRSRIRLPPRVNAAARRPQWSAIRIALGPEIRRAAGRDGDVLPSAGGIGHHTAAHRSAGIESIEHIAVFRVEHVEVAGQLAGEHEIAAGRRDSGHHRPRRSVFPLHRAAGRIDCSEPALRPRRRVEIRSAAHIVLAGDVAELLERGEGGAPVDGWHEQRVHLRAVGRPVPLAATEHARTRAQRRERHRDIGVLARGGRGGEEHLMRIAIDRAQHPVFSSRGDQPARCAVDGRAEHRRGVGHIPIVRIVRTSWRCQRSFPVRTSSTTTEFV